MFDKDNYALGKMKNTLNTKESKFSLKSTDDLNKCIDHISVLIKDAYLLYTNESFATSTFISITIIEEVGKTHIGMFIRENKDIKRGKDPLRNHKSKHAFGSLPTIKMGGRLNKAIGDEMIDKIVEDAETGELISIRESSLYADIIDDILEVPSEKISKEQSRALLLYAIECFDDSLVGYTHHSFEVSETTDELFEKLANNKQLNLEFDFAEYSAFIGRNDALRLCNRTSILIRSEQVILDKRSAPKNGFVINTILKEAGLFCPNTGQTILGPMIFGVDR